MASIPRKFGETTPLTFTLLDDAGVVVDITSWAEVRFSLAVSAGDVTRVIDHQSTPASVDPELVVDTANNQVTWRPTVATSLSVSIGSYDLEVWFFLASQWHPVLDPDSNDWHRLKVGGSSYNPTS